MLTVIGNYIKWCPNKPQSKFALYHLTKCCGKRGQAEQLSINKNVRKYRRCAYVCLPSSCLRAACVCVMNVCKCECTRATWHPFKIRMCSESGQQSGRRKHFRWENMPKIHFNNNSNFSLTYQNTITNTNAILHLELVDFGHFRYDQMVIATGWIFYVLVLATANCRTQLFCGCFVQTKCIWNITALGGWPIEWSGFSIFHLLNLFYSCVSVPLDE